MPYSIIENDWTDSFTWFLIDNGEIFYAFKSKKDAEKYLSNSKIDYWFLTNLENIQNDTMLNPREDRSWNQKTPTCIEWIN